MRRRLRRWLAFFIIPAPSLPLNWIRKQLGGTPEWRRLYAAFSVSTLGDEFTRIALLAKVHELGGETSGLASVVLAQALPGFLIAPLAGALSDRGDKRTYLLVADFARVPVIFAIAFATSLTAVVLLAGVLAALTALFRPVEAACEPELIDAADIPRANAIRSGTREMLSIAGPALVGAFLALSTVTGALVFDALTYALSGLVLFGLPRRVVSSTPPGGTRGLTGELRGGWNYLVGHRGLRILFFSQAALVLVFGCQGPLLFNMVAVELEGDGSSYALLMMALGIGTLIGSWLLRRRSWKREEGLYVLMGILAFDALALFGFTFGKSLFVCCLFMVAMGLMAAAVRIIVRVYLQTEPAAELRGRVLGLFEGIQGPLTALSLLAVIALAEGIRSAEVLRFVAGAELLVAAVSLGLLALARGARRE